MISLPSFRPLLMVISCTVLLGSLTACLDEIPIDPQERPDDGYVIKGQIIQGYPSEVLVTVEELFFFTSNINRPVTNASVRIVKEDGASLEVPPVDLFGNYRLVLSQSTFPVQAGDRFRIEVDLTDTDDAFISDWEIMEEVLPITNLSLRFTTIETVINDRLTTNPGVEFLVTSPLVDTKGDVGHLRWHFIDAYRVLDNLEQLCYFENQYQAGNVYVLDGLTAAASEITNYPLFQTRVGIRHIDGYYLTVFQQRLNETSFGYWSDISSLQDREGTIFDNPAGTVRTNLVNTTDSTRVTHGFFSAIAQDTMRLFVSRGDMGNLPFFCPRPETERLGPPPITVCDNCLLYGDPNPSFIKPPYWE